LKVVGCLGVVVVRDEWLSDRSRQLIELKPSLDLIAGRWGFGYRGRRRLYWILRIRIAYAKEDKQNNERGDKCTLLSHG